MHFTLEQIENAFQKRAPQPIGRHRFFSVLIPLIERDGEIWLLFEVRAKDMQSQPGEICFPGGHVEPGETAAAAALRETFEETGIPADRIKLIGPGNILYGYANYTLYTFLGIVKYEDYLRVTPAGKEVDEVFLARLSDFEKNPPQIFSQNVYTEIDKEFPYKKIGIGTDYPWRVGEWQIPIYEIDGRVIWGLTARITENLIQVLKEQDQNSSL